MSHICVLIFDRKSASHSTVRLPSDASYTSDRMWWCDSGRLQGLLSSSNPPADAKFLPNRSTTWNVPREGRAKFVFEILKESNNSCYWLDYVFTPWTQQNPARGLIDTAATCLFIMFVLSSFTGCRHICGQSHLRQSHLREKSYYSRTTRAGR
jgi:hypothetical protein